MEEYNQTKNPFFDMKDANDLYKKLEYDFKLLKPKDTNVYYYMNFIFTANHLIEWIEKDKNFDVSKKTNIKNLFNLKSNLEFSTIKSLCNKSKHFVLYDTKYESVKSKKVGFDYEDMDYNNFSYNPTIYYVKVGSKIEKLYDVCEKVFNDYSKIFGN